MNNFKLNLQEKVEKINLLIIGACIALMFIFLYQCEPEGTYVLEVANEYGSDINRFNTLQETMDYTNSSNLKGEFNILKNNQLIYNFKK